MANSVSADFKSVYANGLGFVITDNDCRISFGITNTENSEEIEESVAIFMTHKTMKILGIAASKIIAGYEETTGTKIVIDEGKFDEAFGEAVRVPDPAKDAPSA